MRRFIVPVFALCVWLAACDGSRRETEMVSLTGTVTYLQRVALPPEAEVYVVLEDVSLQDAPAGFFQQGFLYRREGMVPIGPRFLMRPRLNRSD